MSSPDGKTCATAGATSCTVTGLTSGIAYTFPAGTTLAPGGYLSVAENPAAFQTKFGTTALGPYTGNLSNAGDDLVMARE